MSRFLWSVDFFLSEKVAMIFGLSQLMVPLVQYRACLEIPDMFAFGLLEVTSSKHHILNMKNGTYDVREDAKSLGKIQD